MAKAGKQFETILPFFFAPDGKINTALDWTGIMR